MSGRWRWVLELSKTPLVGHLEAQGKNKLLLNIFLFFSARRNQSTRSWKNLVPSVHRRGGKQLKITVPCAAKIRNQLTSRRGKVFSGTLGPLTRVCPRVDLVFFGPRKGGPPGGLAVSRRTTLGRSASLALFCVQCSTQSWQHVLWPSRWNWRTKFLSWMLKVLAMDQWVQSAQAASWAIQAPVTNLSHQKTSPDYNPPGGCK